MTWTAYFVNMKLYIFYSFRYKPVMINSAQIRAARGLLKWTQAILAAKAGVSIVTLNMIEGETVRPRKNSLASIQRALETGGVEFIGDDEAGRGVRFRRLSVPESAS